MRIALRDLWDFSTNPEYVEKKWPDDYWPASAAPPSKEAWNSSVRALKEDLAAFEKLVKNPKSNLYAQIPWGKKSQTLLREVLLAADHNSYHTGRAGFSPPAAGCLEGLMDRVVAASVEETSGAPRAPMRTWDENDGAAQRSLSLYRTGVPDIKYRVVTSFQLLNKICGQFRESVRLGFSPSFSSHARFGNVGTRDSLRRCYGVRWPTGVISSLRLAASAFDAGLSCAARARILPFRAGRPGSRFPARWAMLSGGRAGCKR